jgi:hypothetical protein
VLLFKEYLGVEIPLMLDERGIVPTVVAFLPKPLLSFHCKIFNPDKVNVDLSAASSHS